MVCHWFKLNLFPRGKIDFGCSFTASADDTTVEGVETRYSFLSTELFEIIYSVTLMPFEMTFSNRWMFPGGTPGNTESIAAPDGNKYSFLDMLIYIYNIV